MKTLNQCQITQIDEKQFSITASGNTDFFINNADAFMAASAPIAYSDVDYDFIASVKITPDFKETYDAGALMIVENDKRWIKFAFESTDLGYPAVVSVVTDGKSDDCNGEEINEKDLWLKILRKGDFWSLHYSMDGKSYKMMRYFELSLARSVKVGVESQSPVGKGCTTTFKDFTIMKNKGKNMRTGE